MNNRIKKSWFFKFITAPTKEIRKEILTIKLSSKIKNKERYNLLLAYEPDDPNQANIKFCKMRLHNKKYWW